MTPAIRSTSDVSASASIGKDPRVSDVPMTT
jgi:hypothetical protein